MRALWVLATLLSHWRRHPMQFATLLIGLISATALWSGVQALNQQARTSYDRAAATLGGARTAMLVGRDSATFPQQLFVDLRRAGWPVSPVLEGRIQIGGRSFRLLGIEPVTLPAEVGNAPTIGKANLQSFMTPPGEMLGSRVFWLMFVMMTMMSTGGLMIISQFAAFSRDFGVANITVFGLAALPLALTVDRLTNGLTRPFFGWVSDRIGRENTMGIAFLMEAASVTLMVLFRDNALVFVILSGVVFFGWGEIFSLFPSTLTDTFGTKHATTNYGLLYIAQGIGSILGGPLAALLREQTGSWLPVFAIIIAMDALTGILALAALKPMRRAYAARSR